MENIPKDRRITAKNNFILQEELASTTEGVLIVDTDRRIVDYNPKFASMWKIPETVLKKREDLEIVAFVLNQLADEEKFIEKINFLYHHPELDSRDEITFKDGRTYIRYSIPQRIDNQILGRIWIFRDITPDIKMQEELIYNITHDALTNLPGRALLFDRINQDIAIAKRQNEMIALLSLDLDGFKRVNDAHGYFIGDQFLKLVSKRLLSSLRQTDTVARLKEDEFVIVLFGLKEKSHAAVVAKRILNCFQTPFDIGQQSIELSASIGISVYPNDGDTPEKLLKNAKSAVYKAKNHGRNSFEFYESEIP